MKLPQLDAKVKKDVLDESIENCDKQARQRMKSYPDQRKRAKNGTHTLIKGTMITTK